jgi:hypothetical protein
MSFIKWLDFNLFLVYKPKKGGLEGQKPSLKVRAVSVRRLSSPAFPKSYLLVS